MSDQDLRFSSEIPVGIADFFYRGSCRFWAAFFGTALATGSITAGLAVMLKAIELWTTGILVSVTGFIAAVWFACFLLIRVMVSLTARFWHESMIDDRFVGRPDISVGLLNRHDHILALAWLICLATAVAATGLAIVGLLGMDLAVLEGGLNYILTLSVVTVLGTWPHVFRRMIRRGVATGS